MSPVDLDWNEIDARARLTRSELGIHVEDPVPDVVEVIERLGVPVAVWPFEASGPDGIYVSHGPTKLIVLNGSKYFPRFRFTAAHELAHALYNDEGHLDIDIFEGGDSIETRANAFAARFLLPQEGLQRRISRGTKITSQTVLEIANEFGASYETTVNRLNILNFINKDRRTQLKAESSAVLTDELRERRPPADRALPRSYVRGALSAYEKYEVSLTRLAELLRRDEGELAGTLKRARLLHPEDRRE